MTEAPASSKLRTVLDYVPCEACLAQPTDEQELLCSVCRRLDRQIGVRIAVRTTVLLDRPSVSTEAPVIIPPAPAVEAPRVDVRFVPAGERAPKPPVDGAPVEVILEPYTEPVDEVAPSPAAAPVPALEPVPVPAPEAVPEPTSEAVPEPTPEPEREFNVDDIVDYEPVGDLFGYTPAEPSTRAAAEPPRESAPEPIIIDELAPVAGAEVAQDDFVFRPPPPAQEEQPVAREEEPVEDWLPTDEVPVEAVEPREETSPWSRPPEEEPILDAVQELAAEPEPEPQGAPEPEPAPQLPQAEVVEEEEILEMELVEDEPLPTPVAGETDLWRLRGFEREADERFAAAGIKTISHLAGHDPVELSERTGLPPTRVTAWVHVADLTQDVGVPLDAAIAIVAAGVAGPRGLRDAEPDDIVERVKAFGGGEVALSDVKRWKRRV